MFKRLASQINLKNIAKSDNFATSPFEHLKNAAQKSILKSLSEHALNLYEKKTDIKRFTDLALSDPCDCSHEDLVKDAGLDEYDILFDLSNNEEFLKDLGL